MSFLSDPLNELGHDYIDKNTYLISPLQQCQKCSKCGAIRYMFQKTLYTCQENMIKSIIE